MKARTERRKFIEIVERIMVRWGYTATDGKVYAILLLSNRPMTIAELAKETGLSRSSISVALSRLVREYLVTCRREGRTKYFTAVPAFLEKFLHQPRETLEREVRPLEKIVESMIEKSDDEMRGRLEAVLSDLKKLECVLERIIRLEEEESECLTNG
ncbi:ArsR family transcriptional regulator [Thermococcus eurythermalis]|uniref:HTH-type transcriptional regulator n=1 Tax=Thermococcus eurythermalis TaxID=1505907 RepID=A0A097QU05_9EURY|nr:helix-turn-helix domain-containing protein [Thermococcus eurythermalis]AIU69961.1 ArsR family transcriptional regulator [Thermococcus eurythermalis]